MLGPDCSALDLAGGAMGARRRSHTGTGGLSPPTAPPIRQMAPPSTDLSYARFSMILGLGVGNSVGNRFLGKRKGVTILP